jgi:mannosyltransferase
MPSERATVSATANVTLESTAELDRRRAVSVLAAVIIGGAILRLVRLGSQSFWLDEAFSVMLVRAPWHSFVYQLRTAEANSGFYYVLLRMWAPLGDGDAHARLLSAIFGILTIPLAAAVARRLYGDRAALAAAVVMALDPFDIWASQEARGYGLVILLVTCSTWAFVHATDAGRDPHPESGPQRAAGWHIGWWVLYVIASALAVYTHLYASFVLLAQWLSLAVRPRTVPWRALLASGVALAVLLTPMAMFLLSGPHGNIDWIRGSYGHFRDVWNSVRQVLGRGGALAACGYLVVCLALLGVGVVQMRRADTPHARWSYLLPFLWFVTPIAIPLAVSLTIKPVLDPRYATICAPAVALLAAAVAGQPGAWRMRLLAVLVAAELFGDWAYFERLRKENWRGVARTMVAESLPGDVAIFYAPYVRRPFDYYVSRVDVSQVAAPLNASQRIAELYPSARYSDFTLDTVVPLSLAGAVDSARRAPRTWLVLSHMLRSDSACVAALEAGMRPALRQVRTLRFAGGVEVRVYARRPGLSMDSLRAAPTSLGGACPQS